MKTRDPQATEKSKPASLATGTPSLRAKDEATEPRTGLDPASLRASLVEHLHYSLGKRLETATDLDRLTAVCLMVRDRLARRWVETDEEHNRRNPRQVYYLSAEFLLGRSLENNLVNLGIREEIGRILGDLGLPLSDLLEGEPDAGLGNGGLGRLAACFMDSLATLDIPAYGYGIRYEFGIFEQAIRDGFQIEKPELWLKHGCPWELSRPERSVKVDFHGRSECYADENGRTRWRWVGTDRVAGVPFDHPIAGFGNNAVNTLRLWSARAIEELDLASFNEGDYDRAVARKNEAEVISKVLYPNDRSERGRELRLKQEYFFVRCSLVDILRRHTERGNRLETLGEKAAIQLNDTHPSIAVAELMRILVDKYRLEWEDAWEITRRALAFTNHTVMSEALERWPVSLMGRILPRHLELIFEINRRFLRDVSMRWPGDTDRLRRMSLIEEAPNPADKRIRMAHLAIVGSHAVNGVAALHTEILKEKVFRDFHELYPSRFHNVTNGVSPGRWIIHCNPRLSEAISRRIGPEWMRELPQLQRLLPLADDAGFQREILEIKHANKAELSRFLARTQGIIVDPDSVFDMQIKRIHEYKRQLLNLLHVAHLYLRLKRDPRALRAPRTFMIGGKAASAYETAKRIIKLATSIADRINSDPACRGRLALHFIANYRVSVAEKMIPACDVSEQISTAGMEASGTSNMKLALNGALTIGTLDGANVEIREAVGDSCFFLFGMTAPEVERSRHSGYSPRAIYDGNAELREILDLIDSGFFCPEEPGLFHSLTFDLKNHDPYRILADFPAYIRAQARVEEAYLDPASWARMAIVNIAHMGRFSSHRSIREYAEKIWGA